MLLITKSIIIKNNLKNYSKNVIPLLSKEGYPIRLNLKNLTNLVKILINKKDNFKDINQQETNNNSVMHLNLVDSSETTREILNNKKGPVLIEIGPGVKPDPSLDLNEIKFNQWLSGLIDGDGCFGITQNKYPNCEIIVSLNDEKMLNQIKQRFGGSIKLRSNVKALRYRLHNKQGMIKLINAVNGNIRNSKRLPQLFKVCSLLNIKPLNPIKLDYNNAWFIGFFDADGTITYSFKENNPQLTISVTNKYLHDVIDYKLIFGGNIYFDKSQNGYYKWSIQSQNDILNWINNYVKLYPSRSYKFKKLMLVKQYYYLINLKAYKQNKSSLQYKAWLLFESKWK